MARVRRDPEGRMALRAHLTELRNRLIISAVALVLTSVIGWYIYPDVFRVLTDPLVEAAADEGRPISLNYESVTGAFDLRVRISLWLGVIISSPMWIYQTWAFITPGLTRRERWYAVGFMIASVPLFLGGVLLAAAVVPNAVTFLIGYGEDEGTSTILTANAYLSFVTRTLLAFGISFLIPVIMTGLTMVGLIPAKMWVKGWRIAVLLAFVFAAIASPTPDPFVMFALALPIVGLYFLAVLVTFVIDRRRARRMALDPDLGVDPDLDDDAASTLSYTAGPLEPVVRDVDGHRLDGQTADRHSSHRHPADQHADAT